MRAILADCPEDLKPRWSTQDSCFIFPNGSEWHIAGTDKDNAEKLRGTGADLAIIDEPGSMPDLVYVANDILLPQTMDNGGRMILIGTPAKTPGHPYTRFCAEAEAEGAYIKQTIWDNTWITPEQRDRYAKAVGGYDSTTWKREFECEDIIDESLAVIPEFTEARRKECVREFEIPEYRTRFEAMDVGWGHFTVNLFAYYDFQRAKLCIEDEVVIRKMATDDLAREIKNKEALLWGDAKVHGRWSDVAPQLIHDLSVKHSIHFVPTEKDDLHTQVNKARVWVKQGRIEIHPRCRTLITHLSSAIWNKQRTTFQESDEHGHYDAVAAFIYLVRNCPEHVNPFPVMKPGNYRDAIVLPKSTSTDPKTEQAIRSLFRKLS
jgi:hypothetical protein